MPVSEATDRRVAMVWRQAHPRALAVPARVRHLGEGWFMSGVPFILTV
jgi:hypothetical protein